MLLEYALPTKNVSCLFEGVHELNEPLSSSFLSRVLIWHLFPRGGACVPITR